MKTKLRLSIPHEEIVAFCQRHNIRSLAFFGSILREDFSADSDKENREWQIQYGIKKKRFSIEQAASP